MPISGLGQEATGSICGFSGYDTWTSPCLVGFLVGCLGGCLCVGCSVGSLVGWSFPNIAQENLVDPDAWNHSSSEKKKAPRRLSSPGTGLTQVVLKPILQVPQTRNSASQNPPVGMNPNSGINQQLVQDLKQKVSARSNEKDPINLDFCSQPRTFATKAKFSPIVQSG